LYLLGGWLFAASCLYFAVWLVSCLYVFRSSVFAAYLCLLRGWFLALACLFFAVWLAPFRACTRFVARFLPLTAYTLWFGWFRRFVLLLAPVAGSWRLPALRCL
jgi:hypothetical protein